MHRLAHDAPTATPASLMDAGSWRLPVRKLLRPEHIARARAHLRKHHILPDARLKDAG